jgi:hypothetical protein
MTKRSAIMAVILLMMGICSGGPVSWATPGPSGTLISSGGHPSPGLNLCTSQGDEPRQAVALSDSYRAREAGAEDLREFVGGQEVVLLTPYDYHICATILLITVFVVLILLL